MPYYRKRKKYFGKSVPMRSYKYYKNKRIQYTKAINRGLQKRKLPREVSRLIKSYVGVRKYNQKYKLYPAKIKKTKNLRTYLDSVRRNRNRLKVYKRNPNYKSQLSGYRYGKLYNQKKRYQINQQIKSNQVRNDFLKRLEYFKKYNML